jgi:hypothetical protein
LTIQRFRCTFCQHLIPWPLPVEALGLPVGETPRAGELYPYTKCYCGWGKFVLCEESEVADPDPNAHPMHVHDHDH